MADLDFSDIFEDEDILLLDENKKKTLNFSDILEDEEKKQNTQSSTII